MDYELNINGRHESTFCTDGSDPRDVFIEVLSYEVGEFDSNDVVKSLNGYKYVAKDGKVYEAIG